VAYAFRATSGRRPAAIHVAADAEADTDLAATTGTSTRWSASASVASSRYPVTSSRRSVEVAVRRRQSTSGW